MRRAFTLIEMLVVISVIVLLISILLPSLGAARDTARRAACASNLHQITLALHMYTHTQRDWLPQAEPADRSFPNPQHWFMNPTLLRYMNLSSYTDDAGNPTGPALKNTILICPNHREPNTWRDSGNLTYGLSYGMNGTLGLGGRPDHLEQRRASEFKQESSSMLFMDAAGIELAPGIVLYKGCPKDNIAPRHRNKINAAFLDGHAHQMTIDAIPFGMAKRYGPFWNSKKP